MAMINRYFTIILLYNFSISKRLINRDIAELVFKQVYFSIHRHLDAVSIVLIFKSVNRYLLWSLRSLLLSLVFKRCAAKGYNCRLQKRLNKDWRNLKQKSWTFEEINTWTNALVHDISSCIHADRSNQSDNLLVKSKRRQHPIHI